MDDRLVAGIGVTAAALFGGFLFVDDPGTREQLLLAGSVVIVLTATAFIVQLGRQAWRSFEDA